MQRKLRSSVLNLNPKEPNMKVSEAFPSKYLSAADLNGNNVRAIMQHVEMGIPGLRQQVPPKLRR